MWILKGINASLPTSWKLDLEIPFVLNIFRSNASGNRSDVGLRAT